MKKITGFEGYMISPDGKVWSDYLQSYLKPRLRQGYIQYVLSCDNIRKDFLAHRLVALHYVDGYADGLQINHINGIKTDNRSENLEWCTAHENIQHAYDTGSAVNHGSNNPRAKLTEADIPVIRNRLKDGETGVSIAKDYGVTKSMISRINTNTGWQHA